MYFFHINHKMKLVQNSLEEIMDNIYEDNIYENESYKEKIIKIIESIF